MDDITIIDFGGHDENVKKLLERFPHAKVVPYFYDHLKIITRSVDKNFTEWQWIISSCCDYDDFDFSWRPEWHQRYQLHIWASGSQSQGDTFLYNRRRFKNRLHTMVRDGLERIEYYQNINWHASGVARLQWPITQTSDPVETINSHIFCSIYEWFSVDGKIPQHKDISLWYKNRPCYMMGKSRSHFLLSKEMKRFGKVNRIDTYTPKFTEYTNFHWIMQGTQLLNKCDIVYISNGEKNAEQAWQELKERFPDAKRVDGVVGREQAYHEAARISSADYFYAVFPKIKISNDFEFDFQPNRIEQPSHYVFHNKNHINHLTYGHMGIILYHKQNLLDTHNAIDYTMAATNASLPVVGSESRPDNDWWSVWRSAFRECAKLSASNTIESKYRLKCWCENGDESIVAQISRLGAQAGKEYQEQDGDLLLTSEWKWLEDYFENHYTHKEKVLELIQHP